MAFKVNYGLERAERNRLKQAKKEAKLRERKASAGQTELEGAPNDAAELPPVPSTED